METTVIRAEARQKLGTNFTRQVREKGLMPVILYGHGEAAEPVSVSTHDVLAEMGKGSRVLKLNVNGAEGSYLIKAVQYDHWGTHPIHMDLMRVRAGEKVRITVAIQLRGTAVGIKEGGILEHTVSELEIECDVDKIPDALHPNIAHMKVGDVLFAKDITLPAGVTLLSDPELRVASVRVLAEEVAPTPVEGAEAVAEPEVISRGKKEEEGEVAEAK
jgi:large subunit ribosomal protein L25